MKLKKRIISSVLTLAMMTGMIFGTSSLAMAQKHVDDATPEDTTTTAEIVLVDTLYAGSGGSYPDVQDYAWEILPVSFQASSADGTSIADGVGMPRVNATKLDTGVTITLGQTINPVGPDVVSKHDDATPPAPPKIVTAKAYIDFKDDVTQQPIGVYTYKITQQVDSTRPDLTYDTRSYFLDIYVTNQVDENGRPTNNVTIDSMTQWTTNPTPAPDGNSPDNGGVAADTTDTDSKTDATSSVTTSTVGADPAGSSYNVMSLTFPFQNNYPTSDLLVEKYVVGNYSSKLDVFTYDVLIDDGAVADGFEFNIVYSPATGSGNSLNPATIKEGVSTAITLKDGESFTIQGLSKQATYDVTERAKAQYHGAVAYSAGHYLDVLGNVVVIDGKPVEGSDMAANGTDVDPLKTTDLDTHWIYKLGTINRPLDTSIQVTGSMATKVAIPQEPTMTAAIPAGTLEDVKIVYTNEKTVITPTGLVMTYWPYIVAVIAVLAVVGIFVGVKLKKKKSGVDTSTGAGL